MCSIAALTSISANWSTERVKSALNWNLAGREESALGGLLWAGDSRIVEIDTGWSDLSGFLAVGRLKLE
jgi:hypothetical protein